MGLIIIEKYVEISNGKVTEDGMFAEKKGLRS